MVEPIFERGFVHDAYASRRGRGTHAALDRYTWMARRSRVVLQCDIRQCFPSVDHALLKAKLRRKIGCAATLRLLGQVIDSAPDDAADPDPPPFPGDRLWTPHDRRRGPPIGNQTSQFFANVYLDRFDHDVKERLRCAHYVRYVDDFVLLHDDRAWLAEARAFATERLAAVQPEGTDQRRANASASLPKL